VGRGRMNPGVPIRSGVRPTRPQGVERIDDERKRLKIDPDLLDRLRGGEFVNRSHGKNRLAPVQRLHAEPALTLRVGPNYGAVVGKAVGRRGKLVRRKNRFHAAHRERLARIDVRYARVRQRAQQ